ncbi:MAG: hypothetical protein AB1632_04395 [Nitrospirota bacterium]
MNKKKVVDIHIQVFGLGDSGKGCFISKDFIFSNTFISMLMALKVDSFNLSDEKIKNVLLNTIDTSEKIDCAVLLAIDGVHKNGKFILSESQIVIPNDYVIDLVKDNKRLLFGASVHPYREAKQMLSETERCINEGAVLFHWIPSSQQINPEDERCIPFYIRLVRGGIPLICNTGEEFSRTSSLINGNSNRFNDIRRLIKALDIGLKIIVSQGSFTYHAQPFQHLGRNTFEELMGMLRVSEEKKWNLYADISSFCTPSRITYLERIKKEIDNGNISRKRFLYGSGFPTPVVDINILRKSLNPNELLKYIRQQRNLLDNTYNILREFGIHDSIFTNAWDVLRL